MLKDKLLLALLQHPTTYLSGQDLADDLSLSRTAVWKALKELEKDGIAIDRAQSKGYKLRNPDDILLDDWLSLLFNKEGLDLTPFFYPQIDSTNTQAKRLSQEGNLQGKSFLVLANSQTAGRGRYGRPFFSPESTGLYLTLSLPLTGEGLDTGLITSAAAVAVRRAVESVYRCHLAIKWVNDLYLDGKKVCGILSEGLSSMETGQIDRIFIGIGINLMAPKSGVPADLADKMGYLFPYQEGYNLQRTPFLVQLIKELVTLVQAKDSANFLDDYRDHCFLLGQTIHYERSGKAEVGKAITVNDKGHLLIQKADGHIEELYYGEVTLHHTL